MTDAEVKTESAILELAERVGDFNRRFASIVENDRLGTESKNLAIGLLVTLRAPMFRELENVLRARASLPPSTETRGEK